MALERRPMVVEDLGDRVEITVPFRPGLAAGCSLLAALLGLWVTGVLVFRGLLAVLTGGYDGSPPEGPAVPQDLPAILAVLAVAFGLCMCQVVFHFTGREQITVTAEDLTIQLRPFGLRQRYAKSAISGMRAVPPLICYRWYMNHASPWPGGGWRYGHIAFLARGHARRFGLYATGAEARQIVELIRQRLGDGVTEE